ncbi:MAG: phage terminase large subunit [Erysipelothrix sp.]
MDRKVLQLEAKKELARREFFSYCNMMAPDFYRDDRKYLVKLCAELQQFLDSEDDVLVINEPPRHGKSRTAGKFVEWVLGNNITKKIMTGSYNETLSTTFSKNVRNTIAEVKADSSKIVYVDIFPGSQIKQGDGAMNLWSLVGGYNNYLATSPTGTATGFGADIIIIDDLIKSALEANNANVLDGHWDWFTNTMLSRLEAGGKIIIIMTRWHSNDLAGKALEELPKVGYKVKLISMKAKQNDGSMLCSDILSEKEYTKKVKTMGLDIASANYQQEPIDIKGKLYSNFKTYENIPRNAQGHPLFTSIRSYTDTADEGSDYLCNIIYGVYNQEAYVLDVYFTKESMETTEPELAKRLVEHKVNRAKIESNNGGRGFARNVIRILTQVLKSNRCVVSWFHQSQNKKARILTNASWIMEHIYFPVSWKEKWPEFYKDVSRYQKEGKNAHDDAEDCLTGVAEDLCVQDGTRIG